jgi:hypothetical protein
VTTNGEWPLIGAELGFPLPPPPVSFSWSDPSQNQLPRCAPAVAQRLQQLYQDSLSHFDRAYISSSAVLRSRNSQTSESDQVATTPQPPRQQVTEFPPHYQTVLGHAPSDSAIGIPRHAIVYNAQPVNIAQPNLASEVQATAHPSLQSMQYHLQLQVCFALCRIIQT